MKLIATVIALTVIAPLAGAQQLEPASSRNGVVTPQDMADWADRTAHDLSARNPPQNAARIAMLDVAWPQEGEDAHGYTVVLVEAQSHNADELPLRRVYIHSDDGAEVELHRVGDEALEVAHDSASYAAFGPFRHASFYWAPTDALLKPGAVLVDFATNREGFRVYRLPADPPDWYRPDPRPEADAASLNALQAREYPGFSPPR